MINIHFFLYNREFRNLFKKAVNQMETKLQVLTDLACSHCLTDSINFTRSEVSTEQLKMKINHFRKKNRRRFKKEIRKVLKQLNKIEGKVNTTLNEHDKAEG